MTKNAYYLHLRRGPLTIDQWPDASLSVSSPQFISSIIRCFEKSFVLARAPATFFFFALFACWSGHGREEKLPKSKNINK